MFITSVALYDIFTFLTCGLILVFINICFGLCSAIYFAFLAKVLQPHLCKNVASCWWVRRAASIVAAAGRIGQAKSSKESHHSSRGLLFPQEYSFLGYPLTEGGRFCLQTWWAATEFRNDNSAETTIYKLSISNYW